MNKNTIQRIVIIILFKFCLCSYKMKLFFFFCSFYIYIMTIYTFSKNMTTLKAYTIIEFEDGLASPFTLVKR